MFIKFSPKDVAIILPAQCIQGQWCTSVVVEIKTQRVKAEKLHVTIKLYFLVVLMHNIWVKTINCDQFGMLSLLALALKP